jgi:uncharacterized protein (DUF1800 family)
MNLANIAINRFGLGARPGDPAVHDPQRWVLDQFGDYEVRPAAIAALPGTPAILADLRDAYAERRDLKQEQRAATAEQPMMSDKAIVAAPNPAAGLLKPFREDYVAAVGARTTAALASETPFVERLVHFWSNHFAISIDEARVVGLAGAFEFEAIRPHVLGTFREMLTAVEQHPAMLMFLDQAQSVGPVSQFGSRAAMRAGAGGRKVGLNENLAREILELHTLGVRSGYSQTDVTEFARALTGWTVGGFGPRVQQAEPGFTFAQILHEPGPRTIMNRTYAQQGQAQGSAILDDLAVHPATAQHIATKLARHFAADEPPPALIARLEAAFLTSGGDLPTVYRALVQAPEPWSLDFAKFRTPWDWTVASLRATGARNVQPQMVNGLLNQLGQQVWKPGSPAGYDDIAASWAGPDALVRRVEAASRIADRTGIIDARVLGPALFPGALSESTGAAISRAESPAQALALLLVSPEMLRR